MVGCGAWNRFARVRPATKVITTRSVAHVPHDYTRRAAAKDALRYPPVQFTGEQARAIARGFVNAGGQRRYVMHALAIMRDHVHLVMRRHSVHIDQIAAHLKSAATRQMNTENVHPLQTYASENGRVPSPWARGYWCPFIDSESHMRAAIRYVQDNPLKAGMPAQNWGFLTEYEPAI